MTRAITPAVMGLQTAARYLDISPSTLKAKEGEIYPRRDERLTEIEKRPRWKTADLDAWINGGQVKPPHEGLFDL